MRILVTGIAGFIGSHLGERLLGEGHEVIGVDSLTDYYDVEIKRANLAAIEAPELRIELGDVNELELGSLLEGVEVVYHLAGQPGVRASWGDFFEVYVARNVLATQRLLEASRAAGVGRLVYASSSSIYGDAARFPISEQDLPAPISPYGVTKLAGEHLATLYSRAYGLPSVALRYFTVYGPRQRPDMAFHRFINSALDGTPVPVFGDGEQVRDFTYVEDIVAATIAASSAGRPGAFYNVAGGTEASVGEVLELVGELTGSPVNVDRRDPVPGDARRTGADTTLAQADLGYSPAVDLREGLARQVADVRGS